jgi:hypothetical protein
MVGLVLILAAAGCGGSPAGGTLSSGQTSTSSTPAFATTTTTTTQPPGGAPTQTPPPPVTFATYTNAIYHYSVAYPTTWATFGNTPTSLSFSVENSSPHAHQAGTNSTPLKVEIDSVTNPLNQSPADYFATSIAGPGASPVTIQQSRSATVAGRAAFEVVWTSPLLASPAIMDLVSDGDTMFLIVQINGQNGQPSAVFTQMLTSFTITG